MNKIRIVCAACRYKDYLFLAPRHFDMTMHRQIELMGVEAKDHGGNVIQGFIDQYGNFLDRKSALKVAIEAGQVIKKTGSEGLLFSEDIY